MNQVVARLKAIITKLENHKLIQLSNHLDDVSPLSPYGSKSNGDKMILSEKNFSIKE